jgi:excinuclease UvrABC helicase subunit UvrB
MCESRSRRDGILDYGFKVPDDWDKIPESYEEADNKSARENYNFVQEEVVRLVDSGQVVECVAKPRCCNPLLVAIKYLEDGSLKKRLVLDLSRCMNLAMEDDRYRMTTLQDAINSTRKGDFQVVFDLKSAFHHVRLHVDSYELMGFKVVDKGGITRYYYYVVLVFGFKIAA